MSPLAIAILTISDSRTPDADTSGNLLEERLTADGHLLANRELIPDDVYRIRATVSGW
ncbi:MAG TPA: molybdenum cofactor biosynthesis protein, partial [Gammaproteobacteria bacterium]|nr:molybdenum cofactor biosynthesis protein [Gammaproteobacteria bacterium]